MHRSLTNPAEVTQEVHLTQSCAHELPSLSEEGCLHVRLPHFRLPVPLPLIETPCLGTSVSYDCSTNLLCMAMVEVFLNFSHWTMQVVQH